MASSTYPIRPGIYRHYKGKEYEVLGVGKHTETLEDLVFYLDADKKLWARPLDHFCQWVAWDKDGPVGSLRFTYVRGK